jgi:hypothetical protein
VVCGVAEAALGEVLDVGIAGEDLRQHELLHNVSVQGHLLDELELLCVGVLHRRHDHRHRVLGHVGGRSLNHHSIGDDSTIDQKIF